MLRVRVCELADLFQLLQYKYEDHTTSDCPQKDVKVCSNCAETGHTYRECLRIVRMLRPGSVLTAPGTREGKRENRQTHIER